MTNAPTFAPDLSLHFTPLAESAMLIRVGAGEVIDPSVVEAVTALADLLESAAIPGVVDLVPAYSTIMIGFDPAETDTEAVETAVRATAAKSVGRAAREHRTVIIPVLYGGAQGPDLDEMSATVGLAPAEVAARHAAGNYTVACMGFSPGWAYLLGLPDELTIPRRTNPRTHVPAGSVAVGGAQTGVYPLDSPGGWHLIGRTPLKMFDPDRDEPFLLNQGDHVRFAPIDEARYMALLEAADGG